MDSYEIIKYIADAQRKTPAKVYLTGELGSIDFSGLDFFGDDKWGVLFCEYKEFDEFLTRNKSLIKNYKVETDRRNSAIPLADLTKYNARIEPGALIRDLVEIGDTV